MEDKAKLPAQETQIEAAIKKYNVTDAAINKLVKKCEKIKVIDPGDKKGYDLAHETRMEVKDIRVTIEKTRVELNKDALAFRAAVNGEAKRITLMLTPLEDYLSGQEKIVDDEKERLKTEKAEALKKKIRGRVDVLLANGMMFDGVDTYKFLTVNITSMEVSGLSDKIFDLLVGKLKVVFKEESDRKADEEEKLSKEKKEQEEEAERLQKQKDEQDEKDRLQKEAQDKIDKEKQDIADVKEKQEKEEKERVEKEKMEKEATEKAEKEAAEKAEKEEEERLAKIEQDEKNEELRKALLPDKEKLSAFAHGLQAVELPSLQHKQSHETLDSAMKLVHQACKILFGKKEDGKTK